MRRVTSLLAIALAVASPWATAADWQPVASIRAAALTNNAREKAMLSARAAECGEEAPN